MYKPPNVDIVQFNTNLAMMQNKILNNQTKLSPELILGMDHNMNLLNGNYHTVTHRVIEHMTQLNLYPTITRPT